MSQLNINRIDSQIHITLESYFLTIPPGEMETIFEYARNLQICEKGMRPDEKNWMVDFLANLSTIMAMESELNRMVQDRANPQPTRQTPATGPNTLSTFRVSDGQQPETSRSGASELATRSTEQTRIIPSSIRPLPEAPVPTIKLNELVIKPDKFDGKKSEARRWIDDYEAAAVANG